MAAQRKILRNSQWIMFRCVTAVGVGLALASWAQAAEPAAKGAEVKAKISVEITATPDLITAENEYLRH